MTETPEKINDIEAKKKALIEERLRLSTEIPKDTEEINKLLNDREKILTEKERIEGINKGDRIWAMKMDPKTSEGITTVIRVTDVSKKDGTFTYVVEKKVKSSDIKNYTEAVIVEVPEDVGKTGTKKISDYFSAREKNRGAIGKIMTEEEYEKYKGSKPVAEVSEARQILFKRLKEIEESGLTGPGRELALEQFLLSKEKLALEEKTEKLATMEEMLKNAEIFRDELSKGKFGIMNKLDIPGRDDKDKENNLAQVLSAQQERVRSIRNERDKLRTEIKNSRKMEEINADLNKIKNEIETLETNKPRILEVISDAEFKHFIDNNTVSPERLEKIAKKRMDDQPLSPREIEIYGKNEEAIEKLIEEIKNKAIAEENTEDNVEDNEENEGNFLEAQKRELAGWQTLLEEEQQKDTPSPDTIRHLEDQIAALTENIKELEGKSKPVSQEKEDEENKEVEPKTPEEVLSDARYQYFILYNSFLDSRKKGLGGKLRGAKEFFTGKNIKKEDTPQELLEAEEAYKKAKIEFGESELEKERARLLDMGMDTIGIMKGIREYKQNVLFDRLVVQEKRLLDNLKIDSLPIKQKNVINKALDAYLKLSPAKRILVSTAFFGAIAVGGILLSPVSLGTLAAGGAVKATLATGAWLGQRAARVGASVVLGHTVGTGFRALSKDPTEIRKAEEDRLRDLYARGQIDDEEMAKGYADALEKEKLSKRRQLAVRMAVSGVVVGGFNFGLNLYESHLIDIQHHHGHSGAGEKTNASNDGQTEHKTQSSEGKKVESDKGQEQQSEKNTGQEHKSESTQKPEQKTNTGNKTEPGGKKPAGNIQSKTPQPHTTLHEAKISLNHGDGTIKFFEHAHKALEDQGYKLDGSGIPENEWPATIKEIMHTDATKLSIDYQGYMPGETNESFLWDAKATGGVDARGLWYQNGPNDTVHVLRSLNLGQHGAFNGEMFHSDHIDADHSAPQGKSVDEIMKDYQKAGLDDGGLDSDTDIIPGGANSVDDIMKDHPVPKHDEIKWVDDKDDVIQNTNHDTGLPKINVDHTYGAALGGTAALGIGAVSLGLKKEINDSFVETTKPKETTGSVPSLEKRTSKRIDDILDKTLGRYVLGKAVSGSGRDSAIWKGMLRNLSMNDSMVIITKRPREVGNERIKNFLLGLKEFYDEGVKKLGKEEAGPVSKKETIGDYLSRIALRIEKKSTDKKE